MRLSIVLVSILIAVPAQALDRTLRVDQYGHSAWHLRDGALPGHPRSIVQTRDGYLWFATEFGLARFDGVRFTTLRLPEGGFANASATALAAGRDGSLWVGTTHGLTQLIDGGFRAHSSLQNHFISTILEARDGTVWVGTNAGSGNAILCALRQASSECVGEDGTFGRFVSAIHQDQSGALWVGASSGLWGWQSPQVRYVVPGLGQEIHSIIDDTAGVLLSLNREVTRFARGGFTPFARISERELKPTVLLRDSDGGVWVGTQDQGLLHLGNGVATRFGRREGLSGDFVVSLYEDREGNVWVGTLNGLDRFRDVVAARISTRQGLTNDTVMAVQASRDGSVWLATLDGLSHWSEGRITRYHLPGGALDGGGSLLEDNRGQLWVSSLAGLVTISPDRKRINKIGADARYVHAMVEDAQNNVWVSDQNRGLVRIDATRRVTVYPPALFGGRVIRALAADRSAGIWVGFLRGGVSYVSGKGTVDQSFTAADGLAGGRVNALHVDDSGAVWVGAQEGLSKVSGRRIETLRQQDGLPCDAIQWLATDRAGALWLHTACGLSRIDRATLATWPSGELPANAFTVYDNADGVLRYADLGGYGPKVTRATDGRLWFATYDGVGVVDPTRLPFNAIPPPVQVERITVDQVTYTVSAGLQLPPVPRDVRIDYTALSLVAPEKVRFRYRLEGRDDQWIDAGERRAAFYTDLGPGAYRFRVIAANNHGVWSQQDGVLDFVVPPTFYQRSSFRVAVAGVALAIIYLLYRLRLYRLATTLSIRFEERLVERTRIAQELHDTLLQDIISCSMHLHFITADLADPDARLKLQQIVARITDVVAESRRTVAGLRGPAPDDLQHAFARDADALRGGQEIDVTIALKGEPRPLPPLVRDVVYQIGREALTNAFKHAQPSRVAVELDYATHQFRLFVRDDGCGTDQRTISAGRSGHWGLPDMRDRANRIGATLRIWSRPGAGTEVVLSVPERPPSSERRWRPQWRR